MLLLPLNAQELHAPGGALVFLNGALLGVHARPRRLAAQLRALRRAGRVGEFVSVFCVPGRCYVASDGGRVCRPLIIVQGGRPRVTEQHLTELKASAIGGEGEGKTAQIRVRE